MIECAVFDLDGTLLDTLGDLHAAVNHALRAFGKPLRTQEEVRSMIGDGVAKLISRALPQDAQQLCAPALERFKEYYEGHICERTHPYPGIKRLLEELRARGVKTAVLTNKHERAARLLIDEFYPGLFNEVRGGREGCRLKPFPDALTELVASAGAAAAHAAMIGDSANDMLTAKAAGTHALGVAWGFRPAEELWQNGAEAVAENAEELLQTLLVGAVLRQGG